MYQYTVMEKNKTMDTPKCDFCGYPAPLQTVKMGLGSTAVKHELCDLCANSRSTQALVYPQLFNPDFVEEKKKVLFNTNARLEDKGAFKI
jgi:hypothetical protein